MLTDIELRETLITHLKELPILLEKDDFIEGACQSYRAALIVCDSPLTYQLDTLIRNFRVRLIHTFNRIPQLEAWLDGTYEPLDVFLQAEVLNKGLREDFIHVARTINLHCQFIDNLARHKLRLYKQNKNGST